MGKRELIQVSSAYFGVIIGTVIVHFVLQGRIEHVLNKLIMVVVGYLALLVVYILIVLFRRKKL